MVLIVVEWWLIDVVGWLVAVCGLLVVVCCRVLFVGVDVGCGGCWLVASARWFGWCLTVVGGSMVRWG